MNKKINIILTIFLVFPSIMAIQGFESTASVTDYDPLVDLSLTLTVHSIRGLEESMDDTDPSVYLKVFINDQEFESQIWEHQKYIKQPNFSIIQDIPDDQEHVTITLQLWDSASSQDILCDIGDQSRDATIIYDTKTGYWTGDDYHGDSSGYGRLNGCDDGTIYEEDRDFELWFTITQTDHDDDGLPYWIEVQTYGTDPLVSNLGQDVDEDGIPIEWEHLWKYDPFVKEDHYNLDDDNDSISNIEEYLTWDFRSDPFRKDIFLEIDWMEEAPDGQSCEVPQRARELLQNPYHRRNYVFHVDMGEKNGGELIPFKERTDQDEVRPLYEEYFLNHGEHAWRRGVFHYAMFVNLCFPKGYAFSGDTAPYWGYIPGTNGIIVCSTLMEEKNSSWKFTDKPLEYFYGSVLMHEMGHNFGIRSGNPGGCDNFLAKYPWQIQFWIWRTYVSIMNYQYTYYNFDYSDGTHGWNDFDDWSTIDLSYFEIPT